MKCLRLDSDRWGDSNSESEMGYKHSQSGVGSLLNMSMQRKDNWTF